MARVILSALIVFFSVPALAGEVKEADLSGSWYPGLEKELRRDLENYMDRADPPLIKGEIIGLICPHAGMVYSGPVSAYGFSAVKEKDISTVIVVGLSHKFSYDGTAVFGKEGLRTPLGEIYSDKELARKIAGFDEKLVFVDNPFQEENSIELIIPFIQHTFEQAKVVLLVMGRQDLVNSRMLADALYENIRTKDDVLLIASTDLSHYLSKPDADRIDADTAEIIKEMDPVKILAVCANQNRMCGPGPVAAVMMTAKKLGADKAVVLNRSDSSASGAGEAQVVGYLSAAFVREDKEEKKNMDEILTNAQKQELLKIARKTLTLHVKEGKVLEPEVKDEALQRVMGVFVTLHKNGQLRGCIGNIIGREPLFAGVRNMAVAASAEDPRFKPVAADELDQIDIEISVLTPLKKVDSADEIEMGRHGVVVQSGWRSGVYLPQVAAETGWSKEDFLSSLCSQKAGLSPDAWKTGEAELFVFTAEVFGEKD